ncbi:hypothetical protein BDZ94DRAFT_1168832 [Collybia nuda]|uniref:DH domain-containing protein n=1 Tax=Collybia nuda TaxID=64659 RepID=A0A9P5Y167_9AGAR|nr:hypothetical protein BDZ94DRAFT_1168832 [Collybia nuda]
MNGLDVDLPHYKPLPPPARDVNLPHLPEGQDPSFLPPLPPKSLQDEVHSTQPPHLANLPSFAYLIIKPTSHAAGLVIPLTPTTPVTPSGPIISSSEAKSKKTNPLNDLIDTEKVYVDQLTGIIRKVAAAWSRSNLPPPDLDTMFRSIEGVYKANRGLHAKLKELGTNPSSLKALGDLLMRWIDDLKGPYTTYCTKYRCGFDTWNAVQSNPKLPNVLLTFSTSTPPPVSAIASNSSYPPSWTLDDLFLLPKARLKYYKKLYGRLLKGSAPGRSDHRLLLGALDTLDALLDTLENRSTVIVGSVTSPTPLAHTHLETEDEVVIDLRTQSALNSDGAHEPLRTSADTIPSSENGSTRDSNFSDGERLSRETASTSISRGSSATMSMPISDLERRLATQRTLDIFTMKPKVVRLQMAPPSLTYTRELRFSIDVVIHFTPRTTGVEVIHNKGHIFLLSDLFLVCERMTSEDKEQDGVEGADMWLCYPPLAGKVLRVSDVPDQPNSLQVAIMRKETLIIQAESREVRNFMMNQFKECIEFAGSVPPVSKQPPPPMPSLGGLPRSPSAPLVLNQQLFPSSEQHNGGPSPERHYSSSPPLGPHHEPVGGIPSRSQPPPMYQNHDGRISDNLSRLALSPEVQMQQGANRLPSMHDPPTGPPYPRTSSSAQAFGNGAYPYGSGPTHLPTRTTSFGQQNIPRPGPGFSSPPNMGTHGHPPLQQQNHLAHQQTPPNRQSPHGLPPGALPPGGIPPRPPSEPGIRKSPSTRSLASQYSHYDQPNFAPPVPSFPGGYPPNGHNFIPRSSSYGNLHAPQPRPLLPSLQISSRSVSMAEPSFDEPSPPNSPVEETPQQSGPVTSTISAQMKCKVFLQQQHAQWKSLGSAKLKLYRQDPTNIKQLVVEAENKEKSVLISTIVLTDGVERVGKTGVAIELSDKGARTGIIYMIQLRNENSAGGLFDSLLAGSDRATRG